VTAPPAARLWCGRRRGQPPRLRRRAARRGGRRLRARPGPRLRHGPHPAPSKKDAKLAQKLGGPNFSLLSLHSHSGMHGPTCIFWGRQPNTSLAPRVQRWLTRLPWNMTSCWCFFVAMLFYVAAAAEWLRRGRTGPAHAAIPHCYPRPLYYFRGSPCEPEWRGSMAVRSPRVGWTRCRRTSRAGPSTTGCRSPAPCSSSSSRRAAPGLPTQRGGRGGGRAVALSLSLGLPIPSDSYPLMKVPHA
jgi:hypothetical protein